MTTKAENTWPPKVQAELTRLSDRRESAKSKLAISTAERDEGLQEIARMGNEPTQGEKLKCVDIVHALLDIKYQRVVIEKCADGIDKVIQDAKQARFDFADDDTEIPTKQMYLADLAGDHGPKKAADPGKDDAKALEPQRREAETDGPNQHLKAPVKDLDMREDLMSACVAAGYKTVGSLIVAFNTGVDLVEKLNVGQNKVAAIKKAVKQFQKDHEEAQEEAEKDAAATA